MAAAAAPHLRHARAGTGLGFANLISDRGFGAAYKSSELLRGKRGAGILVTEEFLCPKCDGRKEEV